MRSLFGTPPSYSNVNSMPTYLERGDNDNLAVPRHFTMDSTAQDYPSASVPARQQGLDIGDMPTTNTPGTSPRPTTGSGPQLSSMPSVSGGGAVTEFTKRRNWPSRIARELKDMIQILDASGRLRYVSPSIGALTGYAPEDVLDRLLQDFIHPDDVGVFVTELQESMATGNAVRLFYRLKKRDGSWAIFEAVGHAHMAPASSAPNPDNQSSSCQAVFMMARPYPTENADLMDTFLEHKIENERLKRRIAELRMEEANDVEESQTTWPQRTPTTTDSLMPPPGKPASSSPALTGEYVEGVAGNRPDSTRESMPLYGGPTHADTIEMLTGLRYAEGERSHGLTTGNTNPVLIKGDAGIPFPANRDNRGPRSGKRRKGLKTAEDHAKDYVCTDCGRNMSGNPSTTHQLLIFLAGTLESPEWRKGPSGPKSLCNACGIRWAKTERKRRDSLG